jgi:preprotein translocase subunit SecG
VQVYLNIGMIIVSILLITLIIVGARNSTVGSVFGGDSPVYHARRGIERVVFNATVWVSVIFFVLAILSVLATGNSAG